MVLTKQKKNKRCIFPFLNLLIFLNISIPFIPITTIATELNGAFSIIYSGNTMGELESCG